MFGNNGIFGRKTSYKFKIGVMVSWKRLGKSEEKELGITTDIYDREQGGRKLVFAIIFNFRQKVPITMPILSLKLVSEVTT